ncbi:MAG: hypothetical protein ACOZIN_17210 [Myxococcota bacterium]
MGKIRSTSKQREPKASAEGKRLAAKGNRSLSNRTSNAADELAASAVYVNPPGAVSAPTLVTPSGSSGLAHNRGLYGEVVHTTVKDSVPVSRSASADVSRAVVSFSASHETPGRRASAGVYTMKGLLGVNGSLGWTAEDGRARAAGGCLDVTRDSLFFGADTGYQDKLGRSHAAGLFGSISARRDVSDLGPAEEGGRRIELRRAAGGGGGLFTGVATAVLGLGGRFTLNTGREVVFRTSLPEEKARALLFEKKGAGKLAKDKARALGWAKDFPVPDLSKPQSLKVGDEVELSTRGSVTLGAAIGSGALVATAQATAQGEFSLTAKKRSPTQVELTVTPTTLRGVHFSGGTPVGVEVGHARIDASELTQTFTFDLAKPEGLAAYQRALKGELPEKPSPGVVRQLSEKVDARRRSSGGGLSWGPIASLSGIAGLSLVESKDGQRRVVTDGKATLHEESRGVERRYEVLLSGTETAGIHSALRQVTDATGTRFAHLALRARFHDDKVRGKELNDEVIDELNRAFGTSVHHFRKDGKRQGREVLAEFSLTAEGLELLARAPLDLVNEVAQHSGASLGALRALVAELKKSSDPAQRAAVVQTFVAENWLPGLGAVHRLVGGPLTVSAHSDAYEKPLELAKTLSFKYPQPMSATDAGAATERYTEVVQALDKVAVAKALLADDHLLSRPMHEQLTGDFRSAEKTLGRLITVRHLTPAERRALHAALDAGWTSGWEAKLMDHLAATGLG